MSNVASALLQKIQFGLGGTYAMCHDGVIIFSDHTEFFVGFTIEIGIRCKFLDPGDFTAVFRQMGLNRKIVTLMNLT